MKKLMAKQPIQYMGRIFAAGEPLPAHDQRMVSAWLGASSAEWKDTAIATPSAEAPPEPVKLVLACQQIVKTLSDLGVSVIDENGDFVGADSLTGQLRVIFAAENDDSTEEPGPEEEESTPEEAGISLDAAKLARWTTASLEKLAADMGVDISAAKTNAERATILAAKSVQT